MHETLVSVVPLLKTWSSFWFVFTLISVDFIRANMRETGGLMKVSARPGLVMPDTQVCEEQSGAMRLPKDSAAREEDNI